MFTRREFLTRSTAAAASGLSGALLKDSPGESPVSEKRNRPNVVFLIFDQFRWDAVGAYGLNPMGLTPNIDRMAKRGVLFQSAMTNQPVCAPSRACLLTGQYGTKNGVWKNSLGLAADAATFARSFHDAGYTTNYIGKWHLMEADNSLSGDSKGWGPVPIEQRAGFLDLWEAANLLEFTTHPFEGVIYNGKGEPISYSNVYRSDFLTGRAVQFLQQVHHQPFLLVLSIYEPHYQDDLGRAVAPQGYAERYGNPFVPQDLLTLPGHWYGELPAYYGCVKRVDENVGTILETLAQTGLEDNTIVLFTSDHGTHFGTHGREDKRTPHDAAIHVPLVIQGPGFNRALALRELVSHVDIGPTLLDVAGIPIPEAMQGRSAVPLLERHIDDWRNEVLIQISGDMLGRALRTEQFTYGVVAPTADGQAVPASDSYVEYELYDNYADPHQLVNLAGRSPYDDVAARLRQRLKERMVEAGESEPTIAQSRFYP